MFAVNCIVFMQGQEPKCLQKKKKQIQILFPKGGLTALTDCLTKPPHTSFHSFPWKSNSQGPAWWPRYLNGHPQHWQSIWGHTHTPGAPHLIQCPITTPQETQQNRAKCSALCHHVGDLAEFHAIDSDCSLRREWTSRWTISLAL